MRLADNIYITTSAPLDDQESSETYLNTDLRAPEASSISQYYHEQNQAQTNFFQPSDLLSTFLRSFMIVGPRAPQQELKETKNTDSLEAYALDKEELNENVQLSDMLPPPKQDNPNYYGLSKRKNKKYSATDDKNKKYLKVSDEKNKGSIDREEESESSEESNNEESPSSNYEKVELYTEPNTDSDRQGRDLVSSHEDQDEESVETSAPTSRLDFQIHGDDY